MGQVTVGQTETQASIAELQKTISLLSQERDALAVAVDTHKTALDELSRAYAAAAAGLEKVTLSTRELLEDYRQAARERSETITYLVHRQGTAQADARVSGGDSLHAEELLAELSSLRARAARLRMSPSFTIARLACFNFSGSKTLRRSGRVPKSLGDLQSLVDQMKGELNSLEAGASYRLARRIHHSMRKFKNGASA